MGVERVKEVVLLKEVKEVVLSGRFGYYTDPNDNEESGYGFLEPNGKVIFLNTWLEKFADKKNFSVRITISKYTDPDEEELANQIK